jgi:pimeloyl-ACP methyl ester carboxylesterase
MVTESDIDLGGGHRLHVYDRGGNSRAGRLAVFWHHGTPNIGTPPRPLFPAADRLGIRLVAYDRPGYGGSTRQPGRDLANAAVLSERVAGALGVERFGVLGHSGGGGHALACAGLLPGRVVGAVSMAGIAPYGADGLDWYAGMQSPGALRAAAAGRAAREEYEGEFDPDEFTRADHAMFAGEWAWLLEEAVRPALVDGRGGQVDDDVAYTLPWRFDPARVTAPVLLLHGDEDRVVPRAHSEWLARRMPPAELRLLPGEGHISVLRWGESALEWLREKSG